MVKIVDVAINVLGKPIQTTLTLLSLLKHSGRHIDKIYLILEKANSHEQLKKMEYIRKSLGSKLIVYTPEHFFWLRFVSRDQMAQDDVRLSYRYQYAWEKSDKDYLFITHNDCYYTGDIVGLLLSEIGDHIGAGDVGACIGCPAYYAGKCAKEKYAEYVPSYEELYELYAQHDYSQGYTTAFHETDFCEKYRKEPWPLPPCRINEWSCLVNLKLARPLTMPHGPAVPFGAITDCGGKGLDVGAEWFHDVHNMGMRARHCDIYRHVRHEFGHPDMLDADKYAAGEAEAARMLREEYRIVL